MNINQYKTEKTTLYLTTLAPTLILPLITSIIVNLLNINYLEKEAGGVIPNYIDGLILIAPIYLLLGIIAYLFLINTKKNKTIIILVISILMLATFVYSTFYYYF